MGRTIGQKYFQVINGELNVYRLLQINKDGYTVSVNNSNKRKVYEEFLNGCTRLNEDGVLSFNIVQLGKDVRSKDVVVSLFRRSDIYSGIKEPYAACRQCIYDQFASMNTDVMYMGMSLTQDTCPENVPFKSMLSCDGVLYQEIIYIYNDDSLESVLNLLKDKKQFDDVLFDINRASFENKKVQGFSSSLKNMLTDNYFMYDFRKAFNIEQVDFVLKYDESTLELDAEQIHELERIFKLEIFRTYVIPYDKSIDLKEIQRSNIIIADKWNRIFIVAYDKGTYINEYLKNNISDKVNIVKMLKKMRGR